MHRISTSLRIPLSLCIALSLVFSSAMAPEAFSAQKKSSRKKTHAITAASFILMDYDTQKILYSRRSRLARAPASTMKLLTALVAVERLDGGSFTVPSKYCVSVEPTKAGLSHSKKYSVKELIAAAVAASCNDAAIALAEEVSGSEAKFARLMPSRARALGAQNSNFLTSPGLPRKGQYSTAYDMALITRAALRNAAIKQALSEKYVRLTSSDGTTITLRNHNKLLWNKHYPLVLGKTGYTRSARHCFAGVIYAKKKRYVIVVLKSGSLWQDVKTIITRKIKF